MSTAADRRLASPPHARGSTDIDLEVELAEGVSPARAEIEPRRVRVHAADLVGRIRGGALRLLWGSLE